MRIFRAKREPIITRGRLQHVFAGGACYALALTILDPQDSALVVFLLGGALEFSTPLLARVFRWHHPFGDWIDWAAWMVLPLFWLVVR